MFLGPMFAVLPFSFSVALAGWILLEEEGETFLRSLQYSLP